MTATATVAERKAMFDKIIADMQANRAKLAAADRTGFAYTFRAVPGFVMHVDGKGMIGAATDRANVMTTLLPRGHVIRNGKGDIAEYLPMADIIDAAIAANDEAIAEFIQMAEKAGIAG